MPDVDPPPPDELIETDDHVFSDDGQDWTHQTTLCKQPAKGSTKIPYIVRELSILIGLEMRRKSESHQDQSLEFWKKTVVPVWMMQNCIDQAKQQTMKVLKGEDGQRRVWWNLKEKNHVVTEDYLRSFVRGQTVTAFLTPDSACIVCSAVIQSGRIYHVHWLNYRETPQSDRNAFRRRKKVAGEPVLSASQEAQEEKEDQGAATEAAEAADKSKKKRKQRECEVTVHTIVMSLQHVVDEVITKMTEITQILACNTPEIEGMNKGMNVWMNARPVVANTENCKNIMKEVESTSKTVAIQAKLTLPVTKMLCNEFQRASNGYPASTGVMKALNSSDPCCVTGIALFLNASISHNYECLTQVHGENVVRHHLAFAKECQEVLQIPHATGAMQAHILAVHGQPEERCVKLMFPYEIIWTSFLSQMEKFNEEDTHLDGRRMVIASLIEFLLVSDFRSLFTMVIGCAPRRQPGRKAYIKIEE